MISCKVGKRIGGKRRFQFPRLPPHPPWPPPLQGGEKNRSLLQGGGKESAARTVVRSRATRTRVSKPSLPYGQHRLFTGPGWHLQFLGTSAIRRQEQPQAKDRGQRRNGKNGQRDEGHAGEMALDAGVQQCPDAERDRGDA